MILTALQISHVFGAQTASSNIDADTEVSDFDTIKLQRAAKRARLAAATTSTQEPSSSSSVTTTHGQSAAPATLTTPAVTPTSLSA